MTEDQIRWASQHDWFIREDNGEVICKDVCSYYGKIEVNIVRFTNFLALYKWAGY